MRVYLGGNGRKKKSSPEDSIVSAIIFVLAIIFMVFLYSSTIGIILFIMFIFLIILLINASLESPELEMNQDDFDQMNGYQFEEYIGNLYRKLGYSVQNTALSGDQGADLILTKDGEKTAVQVKRYSNKVTNKAVQEVVASKALYNCARCIVVTNNYYTNSALELANANGVELIDRGNLHKLITRNRQEEVMPSTSNDYQRLNSKGVDHAKLGNYQRGIEYYDQALKITKNNPMIWKNKGMALAQLNKYEESIICYDKAIQIDATINNLWHVKGKALQGLGNHKEAIECFDTELSLNPNRKNVWNNKGNALHNLGKYEEATEAYNKASDLGKNVFFEKTGYK
jgi:HJR/Mrr/RecB family endonuclease